MALAASDVAAGAIGRASGQPAGNAGVRLAVAILAFWLAGLCFFIAFGSGAQDFQDMTWQKGGGSGLKNLRKGLNKMQTTGQKHLRSLKGG